MIEKDLMEYLGNILEQPVLLLKRKTTAGNPVYRVTLEAREKTKVFLETILPYVKGELTRSKILELLSLCKAYDQWIADGGKIKAAQLAARGRAKKREERRQQQQQEAKLEQEKPKASRKQRSKKEKPEETK